MTKKEFAKLCKLPLSRWCSKRRYEVIPIATATFLLEHFLVQSASYAADGGRIFAHHGGNVLQRNPQFQQ